MSNSTPIIRCENIAKFYRSQKWFKSFEIRALDNVSFSIEKGKSIGIVGESGCGKSTLAKTLIGLEPLTSGKIYFEGKDRNDLKKEFLISKIQMMFQDPYTSLNPRKKVWEIIAEPLIVNLKMAKPDYMLEVEKMMKLVGLNPQNLNRYPHMFSGGQRQRINLARSLILKPDLIILDEPVSALDVSIQAQILNLLTDLQHELKLTYLFISHDLSVIKFLCHKVIVMYLGKIVEEGSVAQVFNNPLHPYTKSLLNATPKLATSNNAQKNSFIPIQGELPSPYNPPQGCHFANRCPQKMANCELTYPRTYFKNGGQVACNLYE
ncbi:MAG: oligopeptide/dipeptide ABC transporter ATP-binding protein [Bacteriovoracaceae bacterium]